MQRLSIISVSPAPHSPHPPPHPLFLLSYWSVRERVSYFVADNEFFSLAFIQLFTSPPEDLKNPFCASNHTFRRKSTNTAEEAIWTKTSIIFLIGNGNERAVSVEEVF